MALTFSQLFLPQVLPAAVGIIFTCATGKPGTTLKNGRVRLTNKTAGAVTVTLYKVTGSGAPAPGDTFVSALSVGANSYIDTNIPTMVTDDTLQGFAGSAASVNIAEMGGVLNQT